MKFHDDKMDAESSMELEDAERDCRMKKILQGAKVKGVSTLCFRNSLMRKL